MYNETSDLATPTEMLEKYDTETNGLEVWQNKYTYVPPGEDLSFKIPAYCK